MSVILKLVSSDGGEARVAAEGDLRRADAMPGDVNPLESLLGDGWRGMRVLLDCQKAGYIDSAAVGWLIGSARHLEKGGGKLVLHSVAPRVRQVLDLVRIGSVVPIVANESAAREHLAAAAAGTRKAGGGQ